MSNSREIIASISTAHFFQKLNTFMQVYFATIFFA